MKGSELQVGQKLVYAYKSENDGMYKITIEDIHGKSLRGGIWYYTGWTVGGYSSGSRFGLYEDEFIEGEKLGKYLRLGVCIPKKLFRNLKSFLFKVFCILTKQRHIKFERETYKWKK